MIECRLASAVLAKALGLQWQDMKQLKDVQLAAKKDLAEMLQHSKASLKHVAYSREELAAALSLCFLFDLIKYD